MEEQDTQTQAPAVESESTIPAPLEKTPKPKPARDMKKIVIIAVVVVVTLALLGGGAWFLLKEPTPKNGESENGLSAPEIVTQPTVEPTPTEKPVNREEISILVLNGSGVPREASFLQGKLRSIGYENIEVANADQQDHVTTTLTYSKEIGQSVVDEIMKELEGEYTEIEQDSTGSLGEYDVRITTGYRRNFTPTPTQAPTTPTPTSEPTATPTATVSATPAP